MNRPALTADDPVTVKFVGLYQGGMSAPEIGRRYGMCASTVTARLKVAGVAIRGAMLPAGSSKRPRWSDLEALEMRAAGLPVDAIGEHFGISRDAARNALLFAEGRVARKRIKDRRECRMCLRTFDSEGVGNRVCAPCKTTEAWQHGVPSHRVVGARG